MTNRTENRDRVLTFETPFGPCMMGFSPEGITSFTFGVTAPVSGNMNKNPEWVDEALSRVKSHLDGKPQSFGDLPFDFGKASPFFEAVYRALLRVPVGTTVSYKELAARAGRPAATRAVGNAMARNPIPLLIPCHRVLASGGRLGGYSGGGGLPTKLRLLDLEGVTVHH